MKKLLLLISIAAFAINSMAWEAPYNIKTRTVTRQLGDFITTAPEYTNTKDNLTCKIAHDAWTSTGETVISFSNGPESIVYYKKQASSSTDTGILIGQTYGGNTGIAGTHWNANITCYTRTSDDATPKPAFIKSAKINYKYINDNVINLKSDKSCDVVIVENGHTVEINPIIPTKSIFLTIDDQNDVSNSTLHSNTFISGAPLNGVIINSITLEIVTETKQGNAAKDYSDYVQIVNNSYALMSEKQTSAGNDYISAHRGDINQDGKINSTDVVSIYNNIIKGSQTYKDHEYVDLGLPSKTLWATCNVGAFSPTASGDYFAWYEFNNSFFKGKLIFHENNRKYNSAVKAPEGWEGWSLPTEEQYQELIDNTDMYFSSNSVTLKSKINNNSIVFPITGFVDSYGIRKWQAGYYWVDSQVDGQTAKTINLSTTSKVFNFNLDFKYMGNALRLVFKN